MKKHGLWLLLCSLVSVGASAYDGPSWIEGWSFGGDFRLRYEGTAYDEDGKKSRNRGRFRLRMSAKKKILDNLLFDLRLATSGGSATSANQTFDDSFSDKDLVIDRAYIAYDVQDWTLGGGKVKNPFNSTEFIWDDDINPEGLYQRYDNDSFYAIFGQMFMEEEKSGTDSNLFVGQAGFQQEDRYDVRAAFYTYQNIELAPLGEIDFQFVEAVGNVSFGPGEMRLMYIKNTTSEIEDEDTAYSASYFFTRGAITYDFKYAHVEQNSVLGRFTDSNFGIDLEGFVFRGTYKVSKYVSWRLSLFTTEGIVDEDGGYDRVQFDLRLKI